MIRGIERRAVFLDDQDRWRFLHHLEMALPLGGGRCLAWALMPNHVHLLLETGPAPMATVMHRLGTCYAMDFNRRYGRVGHLFQNRYRSELVGGGLHVLMVLRYVHLNPVRAGIVRGLEDLDGYPWTGHRALLGRGSVPFQDTEAVLTMFGGTASQARWRLHRWMAAGLTADPDEEVSPAGSPLLVTDEFPRRKAGPREGGKSLSAGMLAKAGDLGRIVSWVCSKVGAREEDLRAGKRNPRTVLARAAIAYLATEHLRRRPVDLLPHLGVSDAAIGGCVRRGREVASRFGLSSPQAS